jgi:hypothetical protein
MRPSALLIGVTGLAVTLLLSYVPLRSVMLVVPTFGLTFQELRFVAYVMLAFVLALGCRTGQQRAFVVVALGLFVGAIELAQHWIPDHHPSLSEFLSSVVASIGGVALAALADQIRRAVVSRRS